MCEQLHNESERRPGSRLLAIVVAGGPCQGPYYPIESTTWQADSSSLLPTGCLSRERADTHGHCGGFGRGALVDAGDGQFLRPVPLQEEEDPPAMIV
jgi:hypothetical protein